MQNGRRVINTHRPHSHTVAWYTHICCTIHTTPPSCTMPMTTTTTTPHSNCIGCVGAPHFIAPAQRTEIIKIPPPLPPPPLINPCVCQPTHAQKTKHCKKRSHPTAQKTIVQLQAIITIVTAHGLTHILRPAAATATTEGRPHTHITCFAGKNSEMRLECNECRLYPNRNALKLQSNRISLASSTNTNRVCVCVCL